MIPEELEAEILRLHHAEKWKIGTIARHLGIHHSTVRRVLGENGDAPPPSARRSIADPYLDFIREVLAKHPRLTAARIFVMCKERGYPGRPDHFRSIVARLRPRPPAEAFLRLRTLPGEQAQVDWANFGKVRIGERGDRRLMAFVMVLSYSRKIFLRFFLDERLWSLLKGHVLAFAAWQGCARVFLYDNPRTVVLQRIGDAIRFHPRLLALARHYRFQPRPVAIARGNEKGRVERAIRYARESFFAARKWRDLDDLNEQARAWCDGEAQERRWPQDRRRTVAEVFEEERKLLLPLPENPFIVEERVEVRVGKTPYVRFDGNDYSVPHRYVRRSVSVLATCRRVRIVLGAELVADHRRSYDKGRRIEDPEHLSALLEEKRESRRHRSMDRLQEVCPSSQVVLRILADRGDNLGSVTRQLMSLLRTYGPERLERAIKKALATDSPHPQSIRYLLEKEREEAGQLPLLPLELGDPKIRDLTVKSHEPSGYDGLGTRKEPGEREDEPEEIGGTTGGEGDESGNGDKKGDDGRRQAS